MSSRPLLVLIAALLAGATPLHAQTRVEGDLPRKAATPLETTEGVETLYTHARTRDGRRLRVLLTRPLGTTAPLPALFHTQAVVCSSLEFVPGAPSRLRTLASRIGIVLIRVDRSGSGDSEGPGCDQLDYDTEVNDYRDAFDAMARHPWIAGRPIAIYGSSLGSTTAPVVADGKKVAGVAVQGAGGVTYLERMIGFDRLNLDRSGKFKPEERHAEMLRRVRFQIHYLLERKTPDQVVREHPDLAGVFEGLFGTDAKPHYGRPHAWHWQAAARDFLGAWSRIDAPILVAYGEYEQFELRHGHRTIVDTVNQLRPGTAEWIEMPRGGHDMRQYADPFLAYNWEGGTNDPSLFVEPLIAWTRRVTGVEPAPR